MIESITKKDIKDCYDLYSSVADDCYNKGTYPLVIEVDRLVKVIKALKKEIDERMLDWSCGSDEKSDDVKNLIDKWFEGIQ